MLTYSRGDESDLESKLFRGGLHFGIHILPYQEPMGTPTPEANDQRTY